MKLTISIKRPHHRDELAFRGIKPKLAKKTQGNGASLRVP